MDLKKYIILLFLFLFVTTNYSLSQTNFGIKGGVNLANVIDADYNFDSRTGINLGAFVDIPISNSSFSIQPEIIYSQKGTQDSGYAGIDNNTWVEIVNKRDYLEIPVLLKYSYEISKNTHPFLTFGPYFGINMNTESEVTADGAQVNSGELNDKSDIGMSLGLGYQIEFINLNIRYNAGLVNIGERDSKNSVFSASIGFIF
ncbi:MAG: porin family protein [Bacteroidota bacterium]